MKDDNKTSIIKEALSDYNTIMETAEANAKKKLAEEFPDKFNNLLKEEIKNKTKKESYKKLDENEESTDVDDINNEESVMKEQIKETGKVTSKGDPYTKGVKVSEDVKITNTVGKSNPFDKKAKKGEIVEERVKDYMGDVEGDTPNKGEGEAQNGNRFTDKINNPTSGKPISNISEEFDITELDMSAVNSALDEIEGEDQVITIDEIEDEISNMDDLSGELDNTEDNTEIGNDEEGIKTGEIENGEEETEEGSPVDKLKDMVEMLQGLIGELGGEDEASEEITEIDRSALIQSITSNLEGMNDEELTQLSQQVTPADNVEDSITEEEISDVIGANTSPEIEEGHGVNYAHRRSMPGRNLPGSEYLSQGEIDQSPLSMQESKKLAGLIAENKKLTKKLNETNTYKKSASTLIENYKNALEKYRSQLKEMAVFNTNLAHVNNILVNEELALTQEDKIKIINEFKQVNSITESQNKYKSLLSEMKVGKVTIAESLEKKVSTSIQPSSKQKLDEVVEKTAYANDVHINKMKKLINYVESRGKK